VWTVSPLLLTVVIILTFVVAFFPILNVFITKEMIDQAILIIQHKSGSIALFYTWLILQAGTFITLLGINALEKALSTSLGLKVKLYYDKSVATKASKLSLMHFDSPDFFDKYSRVQFGVADKALQLLMSFVKTIQNLITIVGFSALLFRFHWVMGVAMMLFVIPSLWLHTFIGKKRYFQVFKQTPVTRKIDYLTHLLTERSAAKELRIFQIHSYLISRLEHFYWKNANEKVLLEKKIALSSFGVDSVSSLLLHIGIAFLFWLSTIGHMTIGYYISLVQAMSASQNLLQQVAFQISTLHENTLYFNNYNDFMNLPEEKTINSFGIFPHKISKGIHVHNLSFSYSHRPENKVLNNISLSIPPGEKVAIVGENGAGKSTLIKCILGLYPLTKGDILFDNISIRSISPDELRKHVTATFQDFVNYQLSVRENIGLGNVDFLHDDKKILDAAKRGDSYDIISQMKNGLDAELGFAFHGGRELSHGQWQKIAMSRSFLRDAQIIILDEPTSALDPLAEAKVFERFLSLAEDRTAIFISHRLGSCRMADRIIVLKDGAIVEQGNHEYLMSKNGEYSRMFQSQAKWYSSSKFEVAT